MSIGIDELKKLILEEINLQEAWTGDEMDAAKGDMTQQYIDFIVGGKEAAADALERIEKGEEPASAAHDSRFRTLVQGYLDEKFFDYFYG